MDHSSFWSDIKKFEDTLAKDPSSYCFAPLAELYRKSGLIEDAVRTALTGTKLHPDYVGGHMALGRAYLDKGMQDEALASLERVISYTRTTSSPTSCSARYMLRTATPSGRGRRSRHWWC